jgi:5-methyltetrahydrofolate--homocysteine methyltransferase
LTLRQQSQKTKDAQILPWLILLRQKTMELPIIWAVLCDTGFGVDEWAAEFEKDLDDYNSIMVKALADRFAEALNICTNKFVKKFGVSRGTITEAMIEEIYKGIRPPRLSSLSRSFRKPTIWKLLNVEKEIGVTLTESMAMWPASSVSGYYLKSRK